MNEIPLTTQTLYAELLEQLTIFEANRSIGHLRGGFTTKKSGDNLYYYFQYSEPGGERKQVYIGKKSPAILKLVELHKQNQEHATADRKEIERLCAQIRAGGAVVTTSGQARVLRALADAGVFRMGGVLVGTNAFAAMGNMLGYRWEKAGIQTADVDIVPERNLDIALPTQAKINIKDTLDKLKLGFFPVPTMDRESESTSYKVRKKELRVDVLTPAKKTEENYRPVKVPGFETSAQALPYLDFLIEQSHPAAIINGGGILVNIPDPARYALHKLIVSRERPITEQGKKKKDLRQASLLIEILYEERPGDLQLAWEALQKRGASWKRKARTGYDDLLKFHPETPDVLG
ncbi:MAG: hypothetical protein C0623_04440, partial [Desulfuromonas sp.]